MNILVTGATGPLGGAVVAALLNKTGAANISALARNEEKAAALKAKGVKILIGDYDNYTSLVDAFKGIDKVYFVSGNDLINRILQHQNVVNAAKEAGVKHVYYTSTQRKNESSTSPIFFLENSHLQTEKMLEASGLKYTILQHTLYADMIPLYAGNQLLNTGTLVFPAGEGKTTFAHRTELAEAGANLLLDESALYENKNITLTGAAGVSFGDIAAAISAITGKQIAYVSPDKAAYIHELKNAGVPPIYVDVLSGFGTAMEQGEFDQVDPTLETILGRKPAPVTDLLKSVYSKFNPLVQQGTK
jgi:NAD(P)H dehydrogenase (quinone)